MTRSESGAYVLGEIVNKKRINVNQDLSSLKRDCRESFREDELLA